MVEKQAGTGDPDERGIERAAPMHRMTVFGRQGSPTLTLALPFSRVEVKADDAAPLVAELAGLIARLARAIDAAGLPEATQVELAAIATVADALASGAHGTDPDPS
jgi:hypothetical protein